MPFDGESDKVTEYVMDVDFDSVGSFESDVLGDCVNDAVTSRVLDGDSVNDGESMLLLGSFESVWVGDVVCVIDLPEYETSEL